MNHIIDDDTIDSMEILAKLTLSPSERQQAKEDLSRMLDYVDRMKELDTSQVEPMVHVFPVTNVFREDRVTNGDGREELLSGAPVATREGSVPVPRTI
jgi:aspartyl-tRNA(Asn)/glutamyl-tRNA(Gln) amidotransferase subunit C